MKPLPTTLNFSIANAFNHSPRRRRPISIIKLAESTPKVQKMKPSKIIVSLANKADSQNIPSGEEGVPHVTPKVTKSHKNHNTVSSSASYVQ